MHWSIDSLAEAGTAEAIKKLKNSVKNMNIRGWMAMLILIGLILVSVQSAFLLHDVRQLRERANQLQEKSLELYDDPEYGVPLSIYDSQEGEIEI